MSEQRKVVDFWRYHVNGHQAVAPYEWNVIEGTNQRRLRVAEQAGAGLAQGRSEINRIDHALAQFSGELDRARTALRSEGEDEYQAPHGSRYYIAMLSLLALLEIPVNASALDFLRLLAWESYMLAGFLSITNLIIARGSARILRQSAKNSWRDWTMFGVTNLALFLALYGVGQLRGDLISSQTGQVSGIGIGMTFFLLQVIFYLGAGLLSYFQTPPVVVVEQLAKRISNLRTKLNERWRIRAEMAARYNVILHRAQKSMETMEHDCFQRIAQYRDGNMFGRTTATPKFMTIPITTAVFVPIVLGEFVDEHPASVGMVLEAEL